MCYINNPTPSTVTITETMFNDANEHQTFLDALYFNKDDMNFDDQTLLFGTSCIDINKSLNLLQQQQHQEMKFNTNESTPFQGASSVSAGEDSISSFISLFAATTTDNDSAYDSSISTVDGNANAYYSVSSYSYQQQPMYYDFSLEQKDQSALFEPFKSTAPYFQSYDMELEYLSTSASTAAAALSPLDSITAAPLHDDQLFAACSKGDLNNMYANTPFLPHDDESLVGLTTIFDDLEHMAILEDTACSGQVKDMIHPSDNSSSSYSHDNACTSSTSCLSSSTPPNSNNNNRSKPSSTTITTVSFSNTCFTSVFDANPVNHHKHPSSTNTSKLYKRRKSSLFITHHTLLALRRRSSFSAYTCNFCSRTFSRKYDVVRHKRIHTGAKPYVCPCCSKRFARSDARVRHFRTELKCQDGLKTMKKQKKKQQQLQRRKSSLKKM